MRAKEDIYTELSYRIQADARYLGGKLPERNAIAWRGYLAAVLEWSVISVDHYESLLTLIPSIENDPAIAILEGRE